MCLSAQHFYIVHLWRGENACDGMRSPHTNTPFKPARLFVENPKLGDARMFRMVFEFAS